MADQVQNSPEAPDVPPEAAASVTNAPAIREAPVAPDSTEDFVNSFVQEYGSQFREQQRASAVNPDDDWDAPNPKAAAQAAPARPVQRPLENIFEQAFEDATATPPAEATGERQRGPDGRFLPAAEATPAAPATPAAAAEPVAPAAPTNPFQVFGLDENSALDAVSLYNQRENIRKSFEALQTETNRLRAEHAEATQAAQFAEAQRKALAKLRKTDPVAFDAYVNSQAFDQQIEEAPPAAPQQRVPTAEELDQMMEQKLQNKFHQMQVEHATRTFFDTVNNDIYSGFDEKKYAHPFAAKMLRAITASQVELDRLQKRVDPAAPIDRTKSHVANYIKTNASEFDAMIEAEVNRRIQLRSTATKNVPPAPTRGVTAMPQPSERYQKWAVSEKDEFGATLGNMLQQMGWNNQ